MKSSFVDRDMVMRYFGRGIGHLQSPFHLQNDERVVSERDPLDDSDQRSNTHVVTGAGQDTATLDEDSGAEDLDEDSDSEMETSLRGSSAEDETDDDGYDSL